MRRPMCESKGAHIKWDQNWQTGFSIFGHIKHCWMDVTAYSRWRCPKGRGANITGTMGEVLRRSFTTKFYDEVLRQWIVANINGICVSEHYVSSRRLQTWEQKFESDTTKPTWEDRLISLNKDIIVKYKCLGANICSWTHKYTTRSMRQVRAE